MCICPFPRDPKNWKSIINQSYLGKSCNPFYPRFSSLRKMTPFFWENLHINWPSWFFPLWKGKETFFLDPSWLSQTSLCGCLKQLQYIILLDRSKEILKLLPLQLSHCINWHLNIHTLLFWFNMYQVSILRNWKK